MEGPDNAHHASMVYNILVLGHELCTRSSEVYYFGDVTGLDTHAWSMDIMIRGLRTDDTSVGKPIKDLSSRGQDRQGGLLVRILRNRS